MRPNEDAQSPVVLAGATACSKPHRNSLIESGLSRLKLRERARSDGWPSAEIL